MIKNINIPEDQLSIEQRLLYLCKKSAPGTDIQPEIDFLILEREMQQLQQLQNKTCQQIVEFVDEHLEMFIQINNKFKQIEQNIQNSQVLIKKIIPKLDMYKANLFSPQSKIQEFVSNYEKKILQHQLSDIARQQTQFILSFIREFEIFININVEELSQKHKFQIVRLLRKKQFIKWIYEHPLIRYATHNSNELSILLANINQQLQFYLSEQLSRIVANRQLKQFIIQNELPLIKQLQIWYQYLGKQEAFFQIIQESIIGRKLPSLQQLLVSHKQSLVIGNDQIIVRQFFSELFGLVQQFPTEYPKERILRIINKFLSKKQLSFIYSYVVPTFPISYCAYKEALSKIRNQQVKAELQIRHGWNLKFWADLRIKSIMDRSGKDKEKPLNKWIQIIFKKNFMIHGVKNYMIRLAFLLVNRYCSKFEQEIQFTAKSLNQNFNNLTIVTETVRVKLIQSFEQQINQGKTTDKINKVVQNIHDQLKQAIKKWIFSNMKMIISSCKGSLEPYKSFVMGVISKKGQKGMNSQQNILKPLRAYFKNNPQVQLQCCRFVQKLILSQVERYYDSEYVKQIYNYCHSSITTQQMRVVMEIVSVQRQILFQLSIQNKEMISDK